MRVFVAFFFLFMFLGAPAASGQLPVAVDLETHLEPDRVTVVVDETRSVGLRVHGEIQCAPGLQGPRDVNGFVSRSGFPRDSEHPWNISPNRFQIPWEDEAAGRWVIDTTFIFEVSANVSAPEQVAGEQLTRVVVNGGQGSAGVCTPDGYFWDFRSHDLVVVVPSGIEDDEAGVGHWVRDVLTPVQAVVAILLVVALIVALGIHRGRRVR